MRHTLCVLFATLAMAAFGQLEQHRIQPRDVGKTMPELFSDLEKAYQVRFFFLPVWIDGFSVGASDLEKPFFDWVEDVFRGTDINYSIRDGWMIVIFKDPTQLMQRNRLLSQANQRRVVVEQITVGSPGQAVRPGALFGLNGRIVDKETDDPLAGAVVQVLDEQISSVSGPDGAFSLTLPGGAHVLQFKYVNYEEKVIDLALLGDGAINIELTETPALLDEVVVQAGRDIKANTMGQVELSMKELKRAPALLGEVDLIKQIQLLPGVATVSEAASGFNVRGGSVDQNLILYDGLPVFNSSHAFGFFSTFNSEAIRDVTFYRGGIPAEFGGRVSSVLNIRSKEGDYEKWGAVGGIGIISSNLLISGPLVKGKTSAAVSLRTTYSDWALRAVRSNLVDLQNSTVAFFDGSAKITHLFNQKTKVAVSAYQSGDRFRLQDDTTYQWQTSLQAIQFDHAFSNRLSMSTMVGLGRYGYQVTDGDAASGFRLSYQITHPSFKTDFIYQLPRHKFGLGGQAIDYRFQPGLIEPLSPTSDISRFEVAGQRSVEGAVYFSDQWDVSSWFQLDAGLRVSSFHNMGPANTYSYRPGAPRETVNIVDTLTYRPGQVIQSFVNPEPRIAFRAQLSAKSFVKGGFQRTFQYLQLITNSTAVTPVDIWLPSSSFIKPQFADQFSLGLYHANAEKNFEWFLEAYYKNMSNVLDFKDGAQLILNPLLETDLLQGTSRAYGVESQITKLNGRLTGMVSYAYARSFRTIRGSDPLESINGGREFPSNFDQPHTVNLTWKYAISRRYFFTGAFTYHTGRPITVPLVAFSVENINISSFSDRNQYRVPDYHRLDIAFVIEGSHKRKKFWDGTWTFSLFNAYARRNPYTVFFREVRPGILRPYQLSVVGTVIPSISYSFKI